MKLVIVDNYARETISDTLVAEGLSQRMAQKLAVLWNDKYCCREGDQDFMRVYEDNAKLHVYDPT